MNKKPHGNTGNTNAQIGPEPRSARFQVQLPPSSVSILDAYRAQTGESRNDVLIRLIAQLGK